MTPIFPSCSVLSLAFSLAFGTTPSTAANPERTSDTQQAAPDADPPSVSIADGMIALTIHDAHSRDRLQRTITERTQRVLEELDVTPPGDPNLPWSIRIEVRGFSRAYEFSVTAARGGTPLESSAEFIPCACSSKDLRDQIEQHLRQRISSLMEAANEAPRDTSPTPPPPVLLAPPPAPEDDQAYAREPRGGFGAPGGIGVAILGLGVASTSFGTYRALRGDVVETMSQQHAIIRQYRTPATDAAIGVGVPLIVGGIALIVVDQVVCKSRPRGCKKPADYSSRAVSPLAFQF